MPALQRKNPSVDFRIRIGVTDESKGPESLGLRTVLLDCNVKAFHRRWPFLLKTIKTRDAQSLFHENHDAKRHKNSRRGASRQSAP